MALLLAAVLAACAPEPEPRTVLYFMDDGIAREGVLTRCNQDRDATLLDEECANARRAAAAIALEAERAQAADRERESEAKRLALREREAVAAAARQEAEVAARLAAEAAYEARWPDPAGPRIALREPVSNAPTFGTPMAPPLPSLSGSTLFDVYAEGDDPLARRLEVAAQPPANDFEIPAPELELAELDLVPRPFRESTTATP